MEINTATPSCSATDMHALRTDHRETEMAYPFPLSIQPLTAFAKLSYGRRDFTEAEGLQTEIGERCRRRRRGGGRGKKFHTGPEGRNLAKDQDKV